MDMTCRIYTNTGEIRVQKDSYSSLGNLRILNESNELATVEINEQHIDDLIQALTEIKKCFSNEME